jgi:hypothetical protein
VKLRGITQQDSLRRPSARDSLGGQAILVARASAHDPARLSRFDRRLLAKS